MLLLLLLFWGSAGRLTPSCLRSGRPLRVALRPGAPFKGRPGPYAATESAGAVRARCQPLRYATPSPPSGPAPPALRRRGGRWPSHAGGRRASRRGARPTRPLGLCVSSGKSGALYSPWFATPSRRSRPRRAFGRKPSLRVVCSAGRAQRAKCGAATVGALRARAPAAYRASRVALRALRFARLGGFARALRALRFARLGAAPAALRAAPIS